MILPIVAYGAAILRKLSPPIEADYPGLALLIEDMWETMYESNGVGLAAPQINKNIRLFVMDSEQIFANREQEDEVYPDAPGIKKVFINAQVLETGGKEWIYNEGCLSIPSIRALVPRYHSIRVTYTDLTGQRLEVDFEGFIARVFQHEYDHLNGLVYLDKVDSNQDIISEQMFLKLIAT